MAIRVFFATLFLLLVVLGCLRPELPPLLRERWGGIVVALAFLAAAVQLLRVRLSHSREEALLVVLLPLSLAAMYLQPQRVASDGIFYYAPLRSLVVDLDLDFENEYRVLGAEPGYFHRTGTGRLPNHHSIGPALLWLPSFLAAHAAGALGLFRPTGFGYPYFTAVATTTALLGFLGVLFLFRLVRQYFEPRIALVAAALVWLGTFHLWYMVFEPSMSHALAMASVSLFLLLTHRGIAGPRSFFLAGAAGALVALVRWQNVLFLPVALAVSWSKEGRPRGRELLAGALGFLLPFSLQLFYWQALYGSFLLVPQGSGYLDWTEPRFEQVLFSSRHGLLSWAPVLWLGLLGFPRFLRRAPALAFSLAGSCLAALYVNASIADWWAGASFGSRRFDGALPAFALGLASCLEWLVPRVEKRPLATLSLVLAPFVLWNGMLMGVYFGGTVPPDGPASFRQAAADGVELVHRQIGYPFSWPGAVKERLVRGLPLAAYDLKGSESLANNVDIRMGETDALHLGRGWSLPRRGRDGTFREPSPAGAEIFVALAEPAPYELVVQTRAGLRMALRLNGQALGSFQAGGGGEARIELPASAILRGINEILLLPEPRSRLPVFRVKLTRPGEFES